MGTVALVNVSIAETDRHIEAELGYLEALELSITAVYWNQTLDGLRGSWRRIVHRVRILASGKIHNIYNSRYKNITFNVEAINIIVYRLVTDVLTTPPSGHSPITTYQSLLPLPEPGRQVTSPHRGTACWTLFLA